MLAKPAVAHGGRPALTGPGGQPVAGAGAEGGQLALPGSVAGAPKPLLTAGVAHENLDQLKQFVAQDPRVAAQVIKGWVGD